MLVLCNRVAKNPNVSTVIMVSPDSAFLVNFEFQSRLVRCFAGMCALHILEIPLAANLSFGWDVILAVISISQKLCTQSNKFVIC